MNVYHFIYSHPGYSIGDTPSVVEFFCADDDQLSAHERFNEYSNGIAYDNVWVYDTTMDAKTAKDAIDFVCEKLGTEHETDNLMVPVLQKCPSIADATFTIEKLLEIASYDTPKSLKCLLDLLPPEITEKTTHYFLLNAMCGESEYSARNVRILIDSGRVSDPDGSALAHTCSIGKRDLFEIVLPISNLDAAIQMAPTDNFHWLTEEFAARQNERLHAQLPHGAETRSRKM